MAHNRPVKVFVSYAHEDEAFLKDLEEHLALLRRQGLIEIWSDRRLSAGETWSDEIQEQLASSDLILLLVSSSFIESRYAWEEEMRPALKRHRDPEDSAVVVPILVRNVDVEGAEFLKGTQALPPGGNPIASWERPDEAWAATAREIRKLVRNAPEAHRRVVAAAESTPPSNSRFRDLAKDIREYIDHIDENERWSRDKFVELEAEVEASFGRGFRRERLSSALAKAKHPVILLEGDPGSGKSVSLRHYARDLAIAVKDRGLPIPIHLDLRRLSYSSSLSKKDVREFVFEQVSAQVKPDRRRLVDLHFDEACSNGWWTFLLDGFDEIPGVLASTAIDRTILAFGAAIEEFVRDTQCRAVVASRPYRGPRQMAWPLFRLIPLSTQKRTELLRAHMQEWSPHDVEERVELIQAWVVEHDSVLGQLSKNPFFLALLVATVDASSALPQHVHGVFESLVRGRLANDSRRLQISYQLDSNTIQLASEAIGYCMSSQEIGLSPETEQLTREVNKISWLSPVDLRSVMDALVELRLGRVEVGAKHHYFSFSHRRFQEYFMTSLILRRPSLVPAPQLLKDAVWRESCVALLQTQDLPRIASILDTGESLLRDQRRQLNEGDAPSHSFPWPATTLHILGILQTGLSGRRKETPASLQALIEEILRPAFESDFLLDRKLALEVAGSVKQATLSQWIVDAFVGSSRLEGEIAFLQCAQLPRLPGEVQLGIRQWLISRLDRGELIGDASTIRAQVTRLTGGEDLIESLRLAKAVAILRYLRQGSAAVAVVSQCNAPPIPWTFASGIGAAMVVWAGKSWNYDSFTDVVPPRIHRKWRDGATFCLGIGGLLGAAGVALALIWREQSFRVLVLTSWAITTALCIWELGAISAIETGRLQRMTWWPLYPLLAIQTCLSGLVMKLQALAIDFWQTIRQLPDVLLFSGGYFFVVPTMMVARIAITPFLWYRNARIVARVKRRSRQGKQIDIYEALNDLGGLDESHDRYLEVLWRRRLLDPSTMADECLAQLLSLYAKDRREFLQKFRQNTLDSVGDVSSSLLEWVPSIKVTRDQENGQALANHWYASYTSMYRLRLGRWSVKARDSLVAILEQVRNQLVDK